MKLFKSIRFGVVMLLTTSFLISAFIILFNYSYWSFNKEVNGNLLENTSLVSDSSTNGIVKQVSEKSEPVISTTYYK